MPSNHFLILAPTGRVAAIHSGPFVNNEAAVTTTMIPAHLLNRGDEPGLCIANFRDHLRRGQHEGMAHIETIGGALEPQVPTLAR